MPDMIIFAVLLIVTIIALAVDFRSKLRVHALARRIGAQDAALKRQDSSITSWGCGLNERLGTHMDIAHIQSRRISDVVTALKRACERIAQLEAALEQLEDDFTVVENDVERIDANVPADLMGGLEALNEDHEELAKRVSAVEANAATPAPYPPFYGANSAAQSQSQLSAIQSQDQARAGSFQQLPVGQMVALPARQYGKSATMRLLNGWDVA